jgi:hypothetical protein
MLSMINAQKKLKKLSRAEVSSKPSTGTCRDNNRPLSTYSNKPVSNNRFCSICGGDHNVLVIGLENGEHIVTPSFCKRKAIRVKVADGRRRAKRLDLVDIFWPSEKEEY